MKRKSLRLVDVLRWCPASNARGASRLRTVAPLVIAVAVVLAVASPAHATTDFTWTGATPLATSGSSNWSNGTNWGGSAPGPSLGTLSFPALPACDQSFDACYTSYNDVTFLRPNAIAIDDGVGYDLPGVESVSVGAGGLSAAPSGYDTGSDFPVWDVPIQLGANQTWSITGGALGQGLEIDSQVSGVATLGIDLAAGGWLALNANDDIGAVGVSGDGSVALGYPGRPTSLNGISGSTVSFSNGAALAVGAAGDEIGPLTMSGGELDLGSPGQAATLAVNGVVAGEGTVGLSATTTVNTFIAQAGDSPGADYSQLDASGNVDLAGASLSLAGQDATTDACLKLNVGDVLTLVSTSGSLVGTFAGVPDGTIVPVDCLGGPGIPATVRIDYTASSVTATVLASGDDTSTTTSLSQSPANPVTNQAVTLTATINAASALTGTVLFANRGAPIPGCANQPIASNGTNYTATCDTSFTAASSPEALSAVFTSTSPSHRGSTSALDNVAVGKDPIALALTVSNPNPTAGMSVTYTASVLPAHPGAAKPSGTVDFLDGGFPIFGCSSRPLTGASSTAVATCTVSYPIMGLHHSITATYLGDVNFTPSSSATTSIVVLPRATPPSNASQPSITGSATEGKTLSATVGTWQGTPVSYAFQWQRCGARGCANIARATSSLYSITRSDLGMKLRVVVGASNTAGSAVAISREVGPVRTSMAQLRAMLFRQIAPRAKAARIASILKADGYTLSFNALEKGKLVIRWYSGSQSGRGFKPRLLLVGAGSVAFAHAGTDRMNIELTPAGAILLAQRSEARLMAKATFIPSSAPPITVRRNFILRR